MGQLALPIDGVAPIAEGQFGRKHHIHAANMVLDMVSKTRAARHPGYLAEYAFELKLAPFHWEWFEMFLALRECVVKAARGHGKSTIFSVIAPCWMVGADPNLRVVIASATAGQSEKFLREIGHHIRFNERYRSVFGDLYDPEAVWTQKQKTVRRSQALKDSSFMAVGVGSGFAGSRGDVILFDDLVDESNSLTVHRRKQVLNWILQTALPALDPTGPQKAFLIGTPYNFDDALFHMGELWPLSEYPAEDEDGVILWPERFTREELDKRRSLSRYIYATQYLVRPVGVEGSRLLAGWLHESLKPVKHAEEIWGVDWAVVPEDEAESYERDSSALVKYRLTDWGLEIYDVLVLQAALPDVVDWIAGQLDNIRRVRFVACEQNGVGRPAIDMLSRLTKIKLVPVLSVGSKLSRMELMAPDFAARRITIAQDAGEGISIFRREWISFPYGQHDDTLDAADVARRAWGGGSGFGFGIGEA